jgi:hypothetical protein
VRSGDSVWPAAMQSGLTRGRGVPPDWPRPVVVRSGRLLRKRNPLYTGVKNGASNSSSASVPAIDTGTGVSGDVR